MIDILLRARTGGRLTVIPLRRAHYPAMTASFEDLDGNLLFSHR
jgi:hypothetical protein